MELFKNTNYDFLGKRWPFLMASLVLAVAGLGSIVFWHGMNYGIDFKGGAMMTVKFASTPDLQKIRSAMEHAIKGEVSVVDFKGGTASNSVSIGTELQEERLLNQNRDTMQNVLNATFGQPNNGKLDFNNSSQLSLADRLRDSLARAGVPMSEPQLQKLTADLLAVRDKQYSGVITDFSELSSAAGTNPGIINSLKQECYLAPFHVGEV